jgi:branched-chain amino acid transport system permease protein
MYSLQKVRTRLPAPWLRYALPGLLVLGLVLVPAVIDRFLPSFYLPLVTEMLIMGLFAMGFDLLMGYTGMVSFGHAAFFGMGAYVTGLTMLRFGLPVLPAMILGVLGATVAAAFVGFFAIRLKSVYFALLTFAFSQIFYQIAITWTAFTGGFDGAALSMPMQIGPLNLRDRATLYFFVLAIVLLCYLGARRVVQSPFGAVLLTVRENELRAATLGYHVARYKQVAFILSGLLGGIAGTLMVPYQKFISPDLLYWELSGLVIVMVLLGGMGTLWGPLVGGAAVVFLREWLTGVSLIGKHHLLPLGLIFVLLVIFAPNGLAGLLARRRQPLLDDPDAEAGELATPRRGTQPLDAEPRL